MSVEYWDLLGGAGSLTAITGTAMSGLANNASVAGSALNNVQSGGGVGGVTLGRVALSYQFATAPTANTGFSLWFLKNTDGTTGGAFEDGSSSVTPTRSPDLTFLAATDTNAHVIAKDVILPAGFFKVLLLNNATGQALGTTTGNLGVAITPITYQGV
jgi:hypothetical protein